LPGRSRVTRQPGMGVARNPSPSTVISAVGDPIKGRSLSRMLIRFHSAWPTNQTHTCTMGGRGFEGLKTAPSSICFWP
jgi:hypothetical protein